MQGEAMKLGIKKNGTLPVVMALVSATLVACGGGGGGSSSPAAKTEILSPDLKTGQAASRVIGQQNLTDIEENQGGAPGLQTLSSPYAGAAWYKGNLYVPDPGNHRILVYTQGIPKVSNESATFAIGQDSDSSDVSGIGAGKMHSPTALLIHDDKLIVADWGNNRVLIWDQVPTSANAPADWVLGQPDMETANSSCSASGMGKPNGLAVLGGRLLVADQNSHRIMVWNDWPTQNGQPADGVLGQEDLESCGRNRGLGEVTGRGFDIPVFIWSDGKRLAVPEFDNNRVLLWKSWPGSGADMRPADVVVGQQNLTSNTPALGSTGLDGPESVTFDGKRLFVTDVNNNRVLIWNSFPASNGQPANVVLGQTDFESSEDAGSDADSFDYPGQPASINGKLLVPDWDGHRIMIFE